MNFDQYGRCWTTTDELFNMLYQEPNINLDQFLVKIESQPWDFNVSVEKTSADFPKLQIIQEIDIPLEQFDQIQQSKWHMPQQYQELDIVKYILDLCATDEELTRVGHELVLYADRNLIDLLRYMKYFVDTMRENNVVWGIGRGSSTASYVLYLLSVHKIDSIKFGLDISEFLN
jgi:DNA polymerase III alpha subunit